jgi:hypothetical protein
MQMYNTLFWIATLTLFFFEGILTVVSFQSPEALSSIMSLGYPIYFAFMLMASEVLGSLLLLAPQTPRRIREWVYAGFAIDFTAAFISAVVVNGFELETFYPLWAFLVLAASYVSYEKMHPLFQGSTNNK